MPCNILDQVLHLEEIYAVPLMVTGLYSFSTFFINRLVTDFSRNLFHLFFKCNKVCWIIFLIFAFCLNYSDVLFFIYNIGYLFLFSFSLISVTVGLTVLQVFSKNQVSVLLILFDFFFVLEIEREELWNLCHIPTPFVFILFLR
jgi:hypothetical protein